MFKRSIIRLLVGIALGVAGGISLAITIFPYVTSKLLNTPTFDLGGVLGFLAPIIVIWACGGAIVGWFGGAKVGSLALGGSGALAGFMLGAFAIGGDPQFIWIGTLIGLIYGIPAGVMAGIAFPQSVNES